MSFALVEWFGDNPKTYSAEPLDFLQDGSIRNKGSKLIGSQQTFLWKKKPHVGKILALGSKSDMNTEADALAEMECSGESDDSSLSFNTTARTRKHRKILLTEDPVPKKNRNLKAETREKQAQVIHDVISQLPSESDVEESQPSAIQVDEQPTDWKSKYDQIVLQNEALLVSKTKYKRKFKSVRAENKILKEKCELPGFGSDVVELIPGSQVFLKTVELASAKMVSHSNKTILARNLFRRLFTTHELRSHSLYGKVCNANVGKQPLPEIDPARREAVIDFVLYESKLALDFKPVCANRQEEIVWLTSVKSARKEIVKSLSDFLREEFNKALKEA